MIKNIVTYFDKLEDHIRIRLSHRPILYALVGGVGIVLFWKGVWESAEYFPLLYGPGSIALGTIILLLSGLLVSFFIGDSIILSGVRKEKKLVERTEAEVVAEQSEMQRVEKELGRIEQELGEIKDSMH